MGCRTCQLSLCGAGQSAVAREPLGKENQGAQPKDPCESSPGCLATTSAQPMWCQLWHMACQATLVVLVRGCKVETWGFPEAWETSQFQALK